jgi:hypothetical protein
MSTINSTHIVFKGFSLSRYSLLIGLFCVSLLEYLLCQQWQSFILENVVRAGLKVTGLSSEIQSSECLMSAFSLAVIFLILSLLTRPLVKGKAHDTSSVFLCGFAVLMGANLSALLRLTTTVQIHIQNGLSDPSGDAMTIQHADIALNNWVAAGACAGSIFAVGLLGVRYLLRDGGSVEGVEQGS